MLRQRLSRNPEAGSAYIVTLLALVVLTILALTLTLVTQSELQIGGSEKAINRLFYSTDAMLNLSTVVDNGSVRAPATLYLNRVTFGSGSSASNLADRVTINSPLLLASPPSNLGNWALGGSTKIFTTYKRFTATAARVKWTGSAMPDDLTPVEILGTKTVEMELINTLSQTQGDIIDAAKNMPGGSGT